MTLIDEAQAANVTINATLNGDGGDWAPATEVYPIVLGWGVELNAPGVYFVDPNTTTWLVPPNAAILDVNYFSNADSLGYASIVGSASNPIGVGMMAHDPTTQTDDNAAVAVEANNTLYIANAVLNGSANNFFNNGALQVAAFANLVLGQDKSGAITGTVTIGNALNDFASAGVVGLHCYSDDVKGASCTITDAALNGRSSLVIQGQIQYDLFIPRFAVVTLKSNPVFGVAPTGGLGTCPSKSDANLNSSAAAIWTDESATLILDNATIQCMGAMGIRVGSNNLMMGIPTVTIDNALIQNTNIGIYASQGTATVTNSTIRYNFIGVQQDGTDGAAINLAGGGNSVICSSMSEDSTMSAHEGVDVYNTSTMGLAAENVAWDTSSPDYFTCDSNSPGASCTCLSSSCSNTAPFDDMDAVTIDAGILTNGNTVADGGCS
jgi:hypothetical protein